MADIEFVDGLIVKAPHQKAPSFVKARISIKVAELREWLEARPENEEWVNVDVKESKGGKWYAAVSTFKPKPDRDEDTPDGPRGKADDDEEIPF